MVLSFANYFQVHDELVSTLKKKNLLNTVKSHTGAVRTKSQGCDRQKTPTGTLDELNAQTLSLRVIVTKGFLPAETK